METKKERKAVQLFRMYGLVSASIDLFYFDRINPQNGWGKKKKRILEEMGFMFQLLKQYTKSKYHNLLISFFFSWTAIILK